MVGMERNMGWQKGCRRSKPREAVTPRAVRKSLDRAGVYLRLFLVGSEEGYHAQSEGILVIGRARRSALEEWLVRPVTSVFQASQ